MQKKTLVSTASRLKCGFEYPPFSMADITLILPELFARVKASFKYPLEVTFAF